MALRPTLTLNNSYTEEASDLRKSWDVEKENLLESEC